MALLDNIVAYYKLDNENDSVASYTLTNVGSTPFATGKIGNGAVTATGNTTDYLYRDDAFGMLGSTAKTYSFWWKPVEQPGTDTMQMMTRHLYGGSAVGNYISLAYVDIAGVKKIVMHSSPVTTFFTQTLTTGTWYHFVITVPADNIGTITCYMNDSSLGGHANWAQNYALTTKLAMFADHAGTSISSGGIDEFGIWSRVLSGTEITELYNSGAGLQYPFPTYNPSIARRRLLLANM